MGDTAREEGKSLVEQKETAEEDESFGISQIQIIIPDSEPSKAPKKMKKKKKKAQKAQSGPEALDENIEIVIVKCLAKAMRLVNQHHAQTKQESRDEEIREKALVQKTQMMKDSPDRFSRVVL
eukprot:TRINITY_DN632_c0_g1_i1.p1 TRINITY_DN632_c0_g1~~TRINITY_DN632_c0_g1_i1.p1  ORF type:complete len:123 (+),score=39.06 TRINITY_DN632_c0_g1_i1:117-485(+)